MPACGTVICTALLVLSLGLSEGARILGLVPFHAPSHFRMYSALFRELAARGHQVTVVSHYPQVPPLPNYTDVSLQGLRPPLNDFLSLEMEEQESVFRMNPWIGFCLENAHQCEEIYARTEVQQLLDSDEQFDLVLHEIFGSNCLVSLAYKHKAPLIGLVSSMALPWAHDRLGNPDNPAYNENFFLPITTPFSFSERLYNTIYGAFIRLITWWYSDRPIDAIERSVHGPDVPLASDIVANTSLILLNSHFSVNQPIPLLPGMVEVGGLHIKEPKPISKDLREFIDSSEAGVVYFSMGTLIRSDSFSPERLAAIIAVFGSLPQRIIWRVNSTNLPNLPPNVRVASWLPQNDILNHPNTRAFITHGGLLGLQESVWAGVPMVVIPVFADQFNNAFKMELLGVAKTMQYHNITVANLRATLNEVIEEPRYRTRAKELSRQFRDRPRSPMDEAVHWVEYVLRHSGAPHLRSAALDLSWYQYLLLDVAALVLAVAALSLTAVFLALRWLLKTVRGRPTKGKKLKKN